jgi:histidine triad (HIT) family protein
VRFLPDTQPTGPLLSGARNLPASPGHCLIVTKDHYQDIFEATPEAISMVGHVSTLIAHTVKQELQCDGVGIFQLNGAAAGQTVFHYHMHVIPRNAGEDLAIHSRVSGDPEELRAMAERLSRRAAEMLDGSIETCPAGPRVGTQN